MERNPYFELRESKKFEVEVKEEEEDRIMRCQNRRSTYKKRKKKIEEKGKSQKISFKTKYEHPKRQRGR